MRNANGPACPQCGSKRLHRDGLRYLADGRTVQRWLCRECAYRFTQQPETVDTLTLKSEKPKEYCGCVSEGLAVSEPRKRKPQTRWAEAMGGWDPPGRGLVMALNEETEKRAAGATATKTVPEEVKGKLIEYMWHEKKRGLAESTIKQRIYRLKRLVKHGANLCDPDSVSTILAKTDWSPANKKMMVTAYKSFTRFASLTWEPPRVQVPEKLPFIPREEEIDQLIAGCGRKTATFLQVLKDTGGRGIEIARLKWIDVDPDQRTIRINHPVKGSLPRIVKVSAKTIAMINALPRTSEFIFNPNIHTIRQNFQKQRNRIAKTLQNPRIKQIHLHTLRHWKATMEYHKTKDILFVKHLLGHKQIKNTEIYTHFVDFGKDEFHVACAKTLEEEKKLIEAGFDFVRYSEKDEIAIYRKRK